MHTMLLLVVSACTFDTVTVDDDPPDTTSSSTTTTPTVPFEPDVDTTTVPEVELEDDWIFAQDVVHQVEITITDAARATLDADPRSYVTATVSYDGWVIEDVGVRLRGKIGSFRQMSGKPKFKLDFNEVRENQRFFGLEGLNLNNSVVDCTYMREAIGYAAYAAAGVPALRTAYAWVKVNGSDYGLYVVLEMPDDRFLKDRYPDGSGNLYDGKYVWYDDGSYTLLDFTTAVQDLYQLEEGTDVGHQDIYRVTDAINTSWASPTWMATTGAVVDWGAWHRNLAVEQWLGHNDGYALNTNNYRVYFNPETRLAEPIPWDLDYTFLEDSWWGMNWYTPRGVLAYGCFYDPECLAGYKSTVDTVLTDIDNAGLVRMFHALDTLTYDLTQQDPRRECAPESVASDRAYLLDWIQTESPEVRAFWGIP